MSLANIPEQVAELYLECNICRAKIWEGMSDKERAALIETHEHYAAATGRFFVQPVLCRVCVAKRTRSDESKKRAKRFDEAAALGAAPIGLRRYLSPPEGLVAMNPAAWEWAKGYERGNGNLLVMGPEGVGKSSLCRHLMARMLDEKNLPCVDLAAIDIELRYWRLDVDREVIRATTTPILLIDDISNVAWTKRGISCLRKILDERHEHRRDTLVTSNADESELHTLIRTVAGTDVYAESLLRRLRPLKKLTLGGDSYRLQLEYPEG